MWRRSSRATCKESRTFEAAPEGIPDRWRRRRTPRVAMAPRRPHRLPVRPSVRSGRGEPKKFFKNTEAKAPSVVAAAVVARGRRGALGRACPSTSALAPWPAAVRAGYCPWRAAARGRARSVRSVRPPCRHCRPNQRDCCLSSRKGGGGWRPSPRPPNCFGSPAATTATAVAARAAAAVPSRRALCEQAVGRQLHSRGVGGEQREEPRGRGGKEARTAPRARFAPSDQPHDSGRHRGHPRGECSNAPPTPPAASPASVVVPPAAAPTLTRRGRAAHGALSCASGPAAAGAGAARRWRGGGEWQGRPVGGGAP